LIVFAAGQSRRVEISDRRNQMKSTSLFSMAAVSFVTAVSLSIPAIAQNEPATAGHKGSPSRYNITDLGAVGPAPGQPFHITDNGLISGSAQYNGKEQATLWYQRLKVDFGRRGLGGGNSVSFGVNQSAQAVGEADTSTPDPNGEDFCGFAALGFPSGTTCLPFLWDGGAVTALPTLKDKNGKRGNNGTANVINSSGEVVGLAENTTLDKTCPAYDPSLGQTQKLQMKPVAWIHGQIHALPTLGGDPDGVALAINDRGQVAGTSGDCAALNPATLLYIQPVHAIRWDNGKPIDLGSLGGLSGNIATGINNHGAVVGGSDIAGDTTSHGFLWTKETEKMQDLAPFGSDVFSTALAVNDGGSVVGVSLDAKNNPRAVSWERGVPTDLNNLIPNSSTLYLLFACSINSHGEVIGLAVDIKTNETHGYMLTPAAW
jgi:probable HAF family extracellular repeat protein